MNQKIKKISRVPIKRTLKRPLKVAKIMDPYTLILNQGSKYGIEEGQRYQVYSVGEEIFDPDTNNSLGKIEIIKGTGRISHLQDFMSILSSDMKTEPLRSFKKSSSGGYDITGLRNIMSPYVSEVEQQLPSKKIGFSDPDIGDYIRKI